MNAIRNHASLETAVQENHSQFDASPEGCIGDPVEAGQLLSPQRRFAAALRVRRQYRKRPDEARVKACKSLLHSGGARQLPLLLAGPGLGEPDDLSQPESCSPGFHPPPCRFHDMVARAFNPSNKHDFGGRIAARAPVSSQRCRFVASRSSALRNAGGVLHEAKVSDAKSAIYARHWNHRMQWHGCCRPNAKGNRHICATGDHVGPGPQRCHRCGLAAVAVSTFGRPLCEGRERRITVED
mmetsp:Transcript_92397/g.261022  ORF Transcript_92397/g.261022 Transcript_92397/m.261022 type:complete len:240 (-) Transcript_92397:156-875(-)